MKRHTEVTVLLGGLVHLFEPRANLAYEFGHYQPGDAEHNA